jgi:hypothetical protein
MADKKFKTGVDLQSTVTLSSAANGTRALTLNGSKELVESTVTTTELERLSGISSALLEENDKGVANGVASLDAGGKIPSAQIPAIAITEVFVVADIAARDALTVGPGAGEIQTGDVVIVVDASADAGVASGSASYIYDGSAYQRILVPDDLVLSVNGNVGAVVLSSSDLNNTQATPSDWTVADGSSIKAHLDETGSRLTALEGAPDTDELVKVSANDTNSGYLEDKMIGTSGKITVTTQNEGADEDFQINIGADVFDKTADDSDDVAEGSSNLYHTDERAQDAVGTILTDTASIDLTYNDVANTITADVLPAGVDHDALNNYVANEHVDHSSVNINTNADSGLSGGGDITASRTLSVDITGTTSLGGNADDADEVLVHDADGAALRKVTITQLIGDRGGNVSAGDIKETSASLLDAQAVPQNVAGLSFANATVRSFKAQVSIVRGSTYEVYELMGIQKGSAWDMSIESVGDDTGISFSITTAGQVQYTSTTTGSGATAQFRADTTSV